MALGGGFPSQRGLPIGNLTSQIFANIYLHELDYFATQELKLRFLRYGDDFLVFAPTLAEAQKVRNSAINFLDQQLTLRINPKNDIIIPARAGIKFLGTWIYPTRQKIQNRMWHKIQKNLNHRNIASYRGLVQQEEKSSLKKLDQMFFDSLETYAF